MSKFYVFKGLILHIAEAEQFGSHQTDQLYPGHFLGEDISHYCDRKWFVANNRKNVNTYLIHWCEITLECPVGHRL